MLPPKGLNYRQAPVGLIYMELGAFPMLDESSANQAIASGRKAFLRRAERGWEWISHSLEQEQTSDMRSSGTTQPDFSEMPVRRGLVFQSCPKMGIGPHSVAGEEGGGQPLMSDRDRESTGEL